MAKKYNPIEITLDLRKYEDELQKAEDFLSLWKRLNPSFLGRNFNHGQILRLASKDKGEIRINIINIPQEHSIITEKTPFAIYSVLERPTKKYKCYICNDYAPFVCVEDNKKRMCARHVTILEGKMSSYSMENVPKCKGSGKPATFWCDGPDCRKRIAWSNDYLKKHPTNPYYNYCKSCYDKKFPQCYNRGCKDIGIVKCEFVNPITKKTCGNPICNRHTKRWKVFGPEKRGLELCPEHRDTRKLSENDIIYQIIAGTEIRNIPIRFQIHQNRASNADFFPFPSLQTFGFIFRNTKGKDYQMSYFNEKIDELGTRLGNDWLDQQMKKTIENTKEKRERDLARDRDEKQKGQYYFSKLKQLLSSERSLKMKQIAQIIQFVHFVPNKEKYDRSRNDAGTLLVKLDGDYIGLFKGKGRQNIKQFESKLNIRIRLK